MRLPRHRVPLGRRAYHDDSFGFRAPRTFTLPDYTPAQLRNRAENATLLRYVDSVRTHGHRAARIDPLDLLARDPVAALDPARYGLSTPTSTFNVDGILWTKPVGESSPEEWSLSEIDDRLKAIYVGRIAYEYMHCSSKNERLWFSHVLESQDPASWRASEENKKRLHELVAQSEVFDQFLQAKFPNLKRYGLEGGESMIPALDTLFAEAASAGIQTISLAMPHRGRLNLLTGLLKFDPAALFAKIRGASEVPEELGATGDVISHLTASPTLDYSGTKVEVQLLPNPSHLEAASPVAMGVTRAKQYALLDQSPEDCTLGDRALCVQLHGDASFTGQGVVMESLGLSNLPHYTSGGSVHIVVNNNIGYTTPAASARSSLYSSDIGKMINAPVLHVNGDYPEDVARAVEIAFKYRQHFRKDIIIDLLVYRRWGHNELDEPAFTQPAMYSRVRARKSVPTLYEEALVSDEILSADAAANVRSSYKAHLQSRLDAVDSYKPTLPAPGNPEWNKLVWPPSAEAQRNPETGVSRDVLQQVGRASVAVPGGFEIHPRLQRHVKARLGAIEKGEGIDWATAEALAFGSLLLSNHNVRISGQDVGRGTFSQRHAMLVHQQTERVVVPLNHSFEGEKNAGKLELANSSLSEMAVLGFEVGMSWESPRLLPIWEAQFGDFFNGAQVIIDTFISSAETKWLKQSGLVMLLPHGLDGAGPEHSSSRIERFLQLTNDRYTANDSDARINMHVVFPTTPAQYFHLLRRQMLRNYRRPLIVAGPKGLLRLPAAASKLVDMEPGTTFLPVLDDPRAPHETAERILLISGKLYYDLAASLPADLASKIAIIRLEELAPFPFSALSSVLSKYQNVDLSKEGAVTWVQEEPKNQGAWTHVSLRLREVVRRDGSGGGKRMLFLRLGRAGYISVSRRRLLRVSLAR
ncbi:unnamed protein product [Peniophora sp. CBMAI 1063]|nr:unnamed protein product [Peniophora sp. CBMAI 1063]